MWTAASHRTTHEPAQDTQGRVQRVVANFIEYEAVEPEVPFDPIMNADRVTQKGHL